MRRPFRHVVHIVAGAVVASGLAALAPGSTAASPAPQARAERDRLEVYVGQMLPTQLADLVALGVDRHELGVSRVAGAQGAGEKAQVRVEAVLSGQDVAELADQGIEMSLKKIDGRTVTQRATAEAAAGYTVWQQYSGPGGIKAEVEQLARRHPRITKTMSIGKSINGQDILAVKVTRRRRGPRRQRPSVLYNAAQHAREWITPEMTAGCCATSSRATAARRSTSAARRTELWFIPVANPDGYDYTFTEGNRLWRKNLRDNNGDGEITGVDGVDLNRNFPYKWGYDNEGSSPNPASQTYRGPAPGSEPETYAMDGLARRGRLRVPGQLPLRRRAAALRRRLPGRDADARRRDLRDPRRRRRPTRRCPATTPTSPPSSTPPTATPTTTPPATGPSRSRRRCRPARPTRGSPRRRVRGGGLRQRLQLPGRRGAGAGGVRQEPALRDSRRSADDPDDPVSSVGRTAPDFTIDSFDISYGTPQTVAVIGRVR